MAANPSTDAYLTNRVLTASREELRLILIEGAMKFAHQARVGLEAGNHEKSYEGFSNCRAIIVELLTSINPEHDPDLTDKVRGVYMFIFSELVHASSERDIARLDKVIELLDFERETWVMLMDKLAEERNAQSVPGNPAPASLPFGAPSQGGSSLSIQA
jgi:flagellar protein FliS